MRTQSKELGSRQIIMKMCKCLCIIRIQGFDKTLLLKFIKYITICRMVCSFL